MFDLFLQSIEKYIILTAEEKRYVISLLRKKILQKKQFLLRENEICTFSAFVHQGCLRGYTIDDNAVEHILHFAPEGWWIADMYSLLSGKPGNLYIEAIEKTEVFLLSKKDQESLYRDIPKFERFFRIITENSLVANRQRIIDMVSMTAYQRYDQFLERYPHLHDRIPQKMIAHYLGITPEFLSKIKSQQINNL